MIPNIVKNILDEKVYENIIQKRDKYTDIINAALDEVKLFILSRKLILTGGMAIDMALRKKGSSIYTDDTIPDYDFFSPNFHKDAYDLAKILDDKKMPNISVINALHPSTMKVRVNLITVADITYIPQHMFKKLPTMIYHGFKIIHPHYQIIDQHLSLCYPFNNAPRETILHRWKKDMTRYDIFYEKYPLKPSKRNVSKNNKILNLNIPTSVLYNQCLAGFPALLYWYNKAVDLGFISKTMVPGLTGVISKKTIDINMPDCCNFAIYSDNIFEMITTLKTAPDHITWINAFLDKQPRCILVNQDEQSPKMKSPKMKSQKSPKTKSPKTQKGQEKHILEIFDNKGSMLSAYEAFDKTWICNLQSVLLYMALGYIKSEKQNELYLVGYLTAREIIQWAVDEVIKAPNEDYILFLPSGSVYGAENWSESYMLYRIVFKTKIGEEKPPIHLYQPRAIFLNETEKIPKKEYDFEPSKSSIYQFDNQITTRFQPIILPD